MRLVQAASRSGAAKLTAVTLLLLLVTAAPAYADGLGQTPAALAWIDLHDSHGVLTGCGRPPGTP